MTSTFPWKRRVMAFCQGTILSGSYVALRTRVCSMTAARGEKLCLSSAGVSRRGSARGGRRACIDALPERALQSAPEATARPAPRLRAGRRPSVAAARPFPDAALTEREAAPVSHDVVAFGEGLLRLQPEGDYRIEDAARFHAHPGGAELNTCYALAGLGVRAAWFSVLPEGPLGRRVLRHARGGGVDVSLVRTAPGRLGTY